MNASSASKLFHALHYASIGWPVLPLHYILEDGSCSCAGRTANCKPGKHPYGKLVPNGLKNASLDAEEIRSCFTDQPFNIGVATGSRSGIFVLDCDDKHDGQEQLKNLVPSDEPISTLSQLTGAGKHYIYRLPAGGRVSNSTGRIGRGLDIRGEDGYIVAPPSTHVSGNRYRWEDGELPARERVSHSPFWLLDAIGYSCNLPTRRAESPQEMNLSAEKYRPPMDVHDGEGRESTILKMAGSLRAQGIAQNEIERQLLSYNDQHIHPPLDETTVLGRARRYEKQEDSRSADDVKDKRQGLLENHRVEWNLSLPPQSREFVCGNSGEGMFPLGSASVLAGLGGGGKTLAMISCATSVALGAKWGGLDTKSGAVLIISLEDDGGECQRRFGAACQRFTPSEQQLLRSRIRAIALPGVEFKLTSYLSGTYTQASNNIEAVVAEAGALARSCCLPVRLIVIDHMRLCTSGDVNTSEAATTAMSAVTNIANQTGAATVLLTHSPKSDASKAKNNDSFDASSVLGSGAFSDNSRFAAVVTKPLANESKRFGWTEQSATLVTVIRVVKSNYSSSGNRVFFQRVEEPQWGIRLEHIDPVDASAKVASGGLKDLILGKVSLRQGGYTKRKLRGFAGARGEFQASEKMVSQAIDELLDSGQLKLAPPDQDQVDRGLVRKRDETLWAMN